MDARVQKVVTRMRGEFRQEPSLSEMAQIVNLSQSRLRYLFKKEIGIAPGHYLRAFRLEKAKELLETTFLSVKEIISSIGVNDQSHFIRVFKKTYTRPPFELKFWEREIHARRLRWIGLPLFRLSTMAKSLIATPSVILDKLCCLRG